MISSFMLWLILGCMIVTIIPRVVPFLFVRSIQMPEVVLKWLSFIPICIFTALIAEHLFIHTTASVTIHWMYLAVLVPTVLIAVWTKSLSLTVLVGVMLMGTARWLF
ncbi:MULTISPECIES: AzlD domain-containing protein [Bacillus]|uniref:AzlD domain-containing protein n=1 Tax=Bacillus TaxID=1386 RepID=UPI00042F3E1B|nr:MULTISPECIES: AzlD domain-containing protein [Bacillus]AHL70434.1 branched-chain amino acid transporter AzlD [Bacillus pumilus]AKU31368.1 branched-chain amino acid transporter AzlD [Bacillus altitudinis]